MPDENQTGEPEGNRGDERGHTGHDKYRPINLQADQSDPRRSRRGRTTNPDRGGSASTGRNDAGVPRYGSTEIDRGARRYGSHRPDRSGGRAHADGTYRSTSDRHQSDRGGRPTNDRHYGSRTRQRGRSTDSPHVGSQRGSDDQESLGNQYRHGGERGMTHRERRYGSRHGNSTRKDPRRE